MSSETEDYARDAKRRIEQDFALLHPERQTLFARYQGQTPSIQPKAQPVSSLKTAPPLSEPKAKPSRSKGYFLRIKEHNVSKLQSLAIRRFNENLIPSPSITELAKYLMFKDLREASLSPPANPKNSINNQLSDSPVTRTT